MVFKLLALALLVQITTATVFDAPEDPYSSGKMMMSKSMKSSAMKSSAMKTPKKASMAGSMKAAAMKAASMKAAAMKAAAMKAAAMKAASMKAASMASMAATPKAKKLNPMTGTTCSKTSWICNSKCVDLKTDAQNCGACGNKCKSGAKCNSGVCAGGGAGAVKAVRSELPAVVTESSGSCAQGLGVCQDSSQKCGGFYSTGLCPGAASVQCCITKPGDNGRGDVTYAAFAVYANRAKEHYTEGGSRWYGIQHKVMPPQAPLYSDCSATATWCYWTVYGSGKDFLNNANWGSGYTGSLDQHGTKVDCSNAKRGDLVFYGKPSVSHVAIYVGGGMVVSHGSDPAGYYSYTYRSDVNECRSYV